MLWAAALASTLTACGDAYERLHMGSWEPLGEVAAPDGFNQKHLAELRIEERFAGGGAEIKPGSLVFARFHDVTYPTCGPTNTQYPCKRPESALHEIWLWVGREPVDSKFGAPHVRSAFIGRRTGARFSLTVNSYILNVSKRAFLLDFAIPSHGKGSPSPDPDQLNLGGSAERRFEVEVLRVCEGRVLQREATLTQSGIIPRMWDGRAFEPFNRSGTLRWLAVHGKCDSPAEIVRLEKGPAYDPRKGTLNAGWPRSYKAAIEKHRVGDMKPPLDPEDK